MDADVICGRCQIRLAPAEVSLSYMKHNFSAEVLQCPACKEVFISEELARGRIAEVEMELEDK